MMTPEMTALRAAHLELVVNEAAFALAWAVETGDHAAQEVAAERFLIGRRAQREHAEGGQA